MNIIKTFLKSLVLNALTVFAIISFSFLLIYLVPGDPVDFILKDSGSLEDKSRLRESLGLNQSFINQYLAFLKGLLQLNMGQSLLTEEPVFAMLVEQTSFTLPLAFFALLLSLLWGLFFGVFSLRWKFSFFNWREKVPSWFLLRFFRDSKPGRPSSASRFFDLLPVVLFSLPAFVLAPLLTWVFSLYLRWLPVSGAGSFSHLILPSLSLAIPLGAVLMKITRSSLLEVSDLDFVRTAQAKGLSPNRIYYGHILFNALIPIITIAGLQMGALLTGTVIIETLFDRPGLGTLLYRSILNRDYPVVQGAVLWIALLYVFVNRLTDRIYILVNPQMRKAS